MIDHYTSKKEFFQSGETRAFDFRINQLKKLKSAIKENENEIIAALKSDLGKPLFESYTAEIGIIYKEINHYIKNLKIWMKERKVSTPIFLQPGKSFIKSEPKGIVLIISPWNYPFQLTISPLIGAMAAGNCIVIKPSNQSKETEKIISKIIENNFHENYISVVTGPGSKVVSPLIENHKFDHIFFTGSVNIGKEILKLSSKHLTPTTLELGGKSPAIVCEDANMEDTAKKITWGKYYNMGQTCVAPDYVIVHESKKEELILNLKKYIKKFYGADPQNSKDLGRIVNEKRFNKLNELMKDGKIVEGGYSNRDNLYISPTILDDINTQDNVMKEEIFGPILAILSYKDKKEILDIVEENPYPLALYLFTKDKYMEDFILENIQFGGGCINDVISHLINPKLPFGGIGYSGMGHYHSIYTFETFSHMKSIYKAGDIFSPDLKYPPYTERNLNLAKKFLK